MRFALTALACLTLLSAEAEPGAVLRTLGEMIPATDAKTPQRHAFEISATVSYLNRCIDVFAVTDGSRRLLLSDGVFWPRRVLKPGDRITAAGTCVWQESGRYNYFRATSITVLSHGAPPPPADVSTSGLKGRTHLNQVVRVNGTVTDVLLDEIDPHVVFLVISADSDSAYAAVYHPDEIGRLRNLLGAEVSVQGLCYRPRENEGRANLGNHILVDETGDISVLTPAPEDHPYGAPPLEGGVEGVRRASASASPWRKVRGRVLATWQGSHALVLTDGGKISKVRFSSEPPPACHAVVEAVGIPETDVYNLNLTRAVWRPWDGAVAAPPDPEDVSAAFLLRDAAGQPMIKRHYHGRLVRIRGTVVRRFRGDAAGENLILDDGGTLVRVCLPSASADGVPACDSKVEVTGVCVMATETWRPQTPFPRIEGLFLVTRSPDDIRVLAGPPWWTPRRLLTVIGLLAVALVGILVWNLLLQRLSDRKGRALAKARLASSKSLLKVQERARLATELHDTIAQNLTGVSMELRTALRAYDADRTASKAQLALAIKTLDSSRNEIRNCIWDLRSRALDAATMDSAIRRTLSPFGEDAKLSVRFAVPRSRLTDNTAHALICIVRELAVNAMRHGRAKTVRIAGCLDKGKVLASVRDDGCGFDPRSAPGAGQGHFGLQGVQERIDALGGKLEVRSVPGRGTHVSFAFTLAEEERN